MMTEPKEPVNALAPPKYLPMSLTEQFSRIAALWCDIITPLDSDNLARYLIAEQNYLRATSRLTAAINAGDSTEAGVWSRMQDRFFRQCRFGWADISPHLPGRCSPVNSTGFSRQEDELFGND